MVLQVLFMVAFLYWIILYDATIFTAILTLEFFAGCPLPTSLSITHI